jgi:hypothetical protein
MKKAKFKIGRSSNNLGIFDKRQIVGWIAVGLSIVITCFWAVWGILETFHEGWYYESLLSNVGLMFVQYLSPMLIFMGVRVSRSFQFSGPGLAAAYI